MQPARRPRPLPRAMWTMVFLHVFIGAMPLTFPLIAMAERTPPQAERPVAAKQMYETIAPTSMRTIVLPEVDPLEVAGNLTAAGSSTVYPLTKVLYDRFVEEGYSGIIQLRNISSGASFKRFCTTGEPDIVLASRHMQPEERESCAKIGIRPVRFRVGTDALVVALNPTNYFVSDVSLDELAKLFVAEKWSHIRSAWPDEPIRRFFPPADSGTLTAIIDKIFHQDSDSLRHVLNQEVSADHEELAHSVAAEPHAFSFFGYALYQSYAQTIKAVLINGVEPNTETVANGAYPLLYPLFIYSDSTIIREKPQVRAFINFYLTHVNEEIRRMGAFPASLASLNEAKLTLLQALGANQVVLRQHIEHTTRLSAKPKAELQSVAVGTGSVTGVYYPAG
ncbi:substrate-binding domain-containing protein, partial [Candidatus Entotheonella palauensis]|uniref:substrate-binding domain-containing protein n=1 Tax=Candidatus Entotheonella palauensis TaxID=93172 RepID=UPI0015C49AEA